MSSSASAVTIRGNWESVKVVHWSVVSSDIKKHGKWHTEWSTAGRKVREVDLERDTDAIGVGSCRDRAFDVTARIVGIEELRGRKSRDVDSSRRVVLDDRSVAQSTCDKRAS